MNRCCLGLGLAAVVLSMPGCIIAVDGDHDHWESHGWNQVEKSELRALVASNREARLGMSKAEVLGLYPDELTTLKGPSTNQGHPVEVWQVSAVTRDGDASFSRWLYFYNDQLVELSEEKVDWTSEESLSRWAAQ